MVDLLIAHLIISFITIILVFLGEKKITVYELLIISLVCSLPLVNLYFLTNCIIDIFILYFKKTRLYEYLKALFNN